MSDPGEYYSRKYREAKALRAELKKAREEGRPKKELDALARKLELAEYVGD
jgi:hypothetical protein